MEKIETKEKGMDTSSMTMTLNNTSGARRLKFLTGILATGSLPGLTACSTTRQETKGTIEPSGFLGDYSQMQAGEKDRADLYYQKPGVNWTLLGWGR